MYSKYEEVKDFIDAQYKKMGKIGKRKEDFEDKAEFAIYFSNCVLKAQEKYLHAPMVVAKKDTIEFDNFVSKSADKAVYIIEDILEKHLTSNYFSNILKMETVSKLLKALNSMLYISARWDTLRLMQVFDIHREKNKQKVPRRIPLLMEPCICYNRVLETALGIEHSDGFNPTRGVICMPPSSGKTYGANAYTCLMLMHFWIRYGETGLIRMTNNADNAQSYGGMCAKMLEDKDWLYVFPELRKYINNKGKVDIFQNHSTEKILLKDCNSECSDSIFMFGAEAGINGKRSQLGAVLDDLSNGIDDMDNDERHKSLTDKVMSDVMDRSDDDNAPIIVQGTMYNQYDTQNSFIDNWEKKGLHNFKGYNFIQITKDGKCFTCLVDIEDEDGNSIAPDLYTNDKLVEKKNYFENRGKPYVYNLIYRQKRDSREPKTFDLQFLSTYDYSKQCKSLDRFSVTMIDTTRRSGHDYFAMPIFKKNQRNGKYRLVDCIFEQKSLGIVDDAKNAFAKKVCNKIKNDNIIECCIENNTSNTTGTLLKGITASLGYKSCKFRERYTSRRGKNSTKIVRILNMEETIKNHIEFPMPKTLPTGHPLKLFMKYLTEWSSLEGQKKTNPDDAPDSVAMFAEEFIFKRNHKGKIKEFPNIW